MKEIKKTVEVIERFESEDGKFGRFVSNGLPESVARAEVEKYEQSASTVLFDRMLKNGVLRKIENYAGVENKTEEQNKERDIEGICDGIVDNYCGNYFFYIFTPKTEEDIRDLLTYGKMDSEEVWFNKDENYCGLFSCRENELVVGKKYLYCEHDEGYKYLYRTDTMRNRLNDWIDWLENH